VERLIWTFSFKILLELGDSLTNHQRTIRLRIARPLEDMREVIDPFCLWRIEADGHYSVPLLFVTRLQEAVGAWLTYCSRGAFQETAFFKCLSKNIFTYTANFQDVVRYGAMTVLGLNEAE